MNIVITGAAGLVGLHLLPHLVRAGHRVVACDKHAHNMQLAQKLYPSIQAHAIDLSQNESSWAHVFAHADVVIMAQAQITSPLKQDHVRNNVSSVRNVLNACVQHRIPHLIHISSSVVLTRARDFYTITKTEGEDLVKNSGLPHTIVRPPLMYGIFEKKHIGHIVDLLQRYHVLPLPGSGRYMRQPLYVEDLCAVIMRCLQKKPNNTSHNIIGHERFDFVDLVKASARARRVKGLLIPTPLPLFYAALKTANILHLPVPFVPEQLNALTAGDDFAVENWAKDFGVTYTPFKQGLNDMLSSPLWAARQDFWPNQ